jgi:ATP-dependent exoDNAse (exonuclease V) beta subunit
LPYGVYPEYLISRTSDDGILNIAGQIDCLVKNGNEIVIIDHKTNKKLDLKGGFNTVTKSTAKMLYPLNNLDDCNFNHYQLQLSTYAWMLQKINPDFVIKDLILNHYDHEGNNTLYHCDYLKTEVERMLAYYKKGLIRDIQRAKRAPIEY